MFLALIPSWGELLMAGVVGLLLFGGRLPEVAKDAGRAFFRLRRTLTGMRRETGIDRTLRDLRLEIEREDANLPEAPPIQDAEGIVSREEDAPSSDIDD